MDSNVPNMTTQPTQTVPMPPQQREAYGVPPQAQQQMVPAQAQVSPEQAAMIQAAMAPTISKVEDLAKMHQPVSRLRKAGEIALGAGIIIAVSAVTTLTIQYIQRKRAEKEKLAKR